MTDIIKFNETHTPKTEIGKMKFELAEALTAISDLQNPYRLTELSKEQRYKLYNKSMRKVCEILDIDIDMHEMMKTGSEGFSYSDTEDNTKPLEKLLNDKQSHDIKTKLFNLFTLASGLSHSDTDFVAVDDKGAETPASQQELAKALRMNLVELTESLGLSLDQVTESHTEQVQDKVKAIIGDLIGDTLEQLYEPLGIELPDQEVYDSLPAEDKLNVDMLNKLHEVQDHVLNSGQDAVSMNQVQTAISILEGSLGVVGKVEE